MPCCFAILTYAQCRHHNLFKIGCTAHCEDFCPPEKRKILVKTRYLWCCEQCHTRVNDNIDEEREDDWSVQIMRVCQQPGPQALIEARIDGMRCREQFKQRRRDGALMSQVEEIQWVGEWTLEYGLVVFKSVHGSAWVKRKLQDRLEQLRDLRFWDFVVTHDALRGSKKLYKEQSHSAYWTAYHSILREHIKRGGLRRPNRRLPPPPLFDNADEATTPADEWKDVLEIGTEEELEVMAEMDRAKLDKTIPRSMVHKCLQTDLVATLNEDVEGDEKGVMVERQRNTIDDIE
ncbi:hypothetical protein NCS52_01177100 [Fusarium sp. LHS14.1]|nr:hypothetical protein NCS52_01177100 [Fusarium sp. LHS14.1]